MPEIKMFPEATPDVVLPGRARGRQHELHTTVSASYEVAARIHAELAARFEAAGQRERARRERELAVEHGRMARLASLRAAARETPVESPHQRTDVSAPE